MRLRAAIFRVFKKTTQYSQQDSLFSRLCCINIPIHSGTIHTSLLQSWTLAGDIWLYSSSEGSSSAIHLHSKLHELIPSFQGKKTCPLTPFLPYKIPKVTGESDHKTALRQKRHFKPKGPPWGHSASDRAVTGSSRAPARTEEEAGWAGSHLCPDTFGHMISRLSLLKLFMVSRPPAHWRTKVLNTALAKIIHSSVSTLCLTYFLLKQTRKGWDKPLNKEKT